MVCSPPGSSVQGVLQARILEWVSLTPSRVVSSCCWVVGVTVYILHASRFSDVCIANILLQTIILTGSSPWGHKELDMTEWAHMQWWVPQCMSVVCYFASLQYWTGCFWPYHMSVMPPNHSKGFHIHCLNVSPNQSVSGAGQVILTLIDLVRPNTDQEENRKIQFCCSHSSPGKMQHAMPGH